LSSSASLVEEYGGLSPLDRGEKKS